MIDDFQAPDDPGYGYDDCGPGKAIRHISPIQRGRCTEIKRPLTISSFWLYDLTVIRMPQLFAALSRRLAPTCFV
jgi:hypothetical protein